ncbi:MAG: SPOR domain-containing protein [Peptococcaceae bacterium]|nr:SPOR domain-containing protein [Peptococcaceae bacterium]
MKKKFNAIKVLITAIVVILGISGIGWFTWYFGKMFVGLVSAGTPEPQMKMEQTGSEILSLSKIGLWTCQAGVYQEQKNANSMVDLLKLKGWKAEVIKTGPYTVGIGAFNNKETAVLLCKILGEQGIKTWIKEETFPALHYKVSGKNVEIITSMLEITNSLLNGKEKDKVKEELAGDVETIFAGECPADFQKLNAILQGILRKEYENKDSNNLYGQDLLGLYAEYKTVTTKYFKNTK